MHCRRYIREECIAENLRDSFQEVSIGTAATTAQKGLQKRMCGHPAAFLTHNLKAPAAIVNMPVCLGFLRHSSFVYVCMRQATPFPPKDLDMHSMAGMSQDERRLR